ncbi:conserved hypothetical protein; putative phospholipase D endonuclease domain [Alkaliphilus metalliredigens QYMF]|uniref:phospholipase D n=1 Tax=Alkaliphilus metalliredigens (strain QYMF) TaxID=293826 RepID=A6TNN3_ALKMQ|nr:phospholipase D family protein [Alkaliphilus metalliredigens]ABR47801.1 conserved hypothetical protein; putative phospholipase D endonuclease domain [Alkaliphilus metalliredigens QYMF]
MKRLRKRYFLYVIFSVAFLTSIFHLVKPLPEDISFNGAFHAVTDVEFLSDITYVMEDGNGIQEQAIFKRIHESIDAAEDYIVIDMFLFNDDYDRAYSYPELSMELSNALVQKRKEQPDVEIVFITDRINSVYGTYTIEQLEKMKAQGIEVIETDMRKLRDSNPLYSGFWRAYIQWFGTDGFDWLPNPFGTESPSVNVRSYLELLNFKANHRKVVLTEKEAIISSGNPHDASAFHSNIAFVLKGDIVGDFLTTEKTVASISGSNIEFEYIESDMKTNADINVKVITEGQIKKELLDSINSTENGDEIRMGMFYLSDRDIVTALKNAANSGVDIKLVLDPNKDAFGMEKSGIPNRQVASELTNNSPVEVRWYDTQGEQYHSKITLIKKEKESIIIGGSANLTKRNIGDLNLETNVMIVADNDKEISSEVYNYFETIWNNVEGVYTTDYVIYQDDSVMKKVLYRIQEWTGLSTF